MCHSTLFIYCIVAFSHCLILRQCHLTCHPIVLLYYSVIIQLGDSLRIAPLTLFAYSIFYFTMAEHNTLLIYL